MKLQFDPTFFKIKDKKEDVRLTDPAEEALKSAEDREINHFSSLMGALLAGPLVQSDKAVANNWYKEVLQGAPEQDQKQFYLDPAVGETKKLDDKDLPAPKEAPLKLTDKEPKPETVSTPKAATDHKEAAAQKPVPNEAGDAKTAKETTAQDAQAQPAAKNVVKENTINSKEFLAKLAAETKAEKAPVSVAAETVKEAGSEKAETAPQKAAPKTAAATVADTNTAKMPLEQDARQTDTPKQQANERSADILAKAAGMKPKLGAEDGLRSSLAKEADGVRHQSEVNSNQAAPKNPTHTEVKTLESILGGGSSQTGSGKSGEQNPGGNNQRFQFGQGVEKATGGRREAAARTAVKRGQNSPLHQKNFNELIKQTKIAIQARNRGTISIRLNPEYMGQVHLKFEVQDGQLQGLIRVETAEARALFQQNLGDLYKQFESSGLNVEDMKIEYEGEQKENAHELPEQEEEDLTPHSDRDWGDAGEYLPGDQTMTQNDYQAGNLNLQA